jgi:hypothetical protein
MSRHVQFDLGLARHERMHILLMCAVSVTAAAVGLLLSSRGWICLLAAGLVLVGLNCAIRSVGGTRIIVSKHCLEIHPTGQLGKPFTLLYQDIGYVERILSSTRILVWTYQGQFLWVGPFQDLNFLRTRRKLRVLTRTICARAHIREGEVPADAQPKPGGS